MTDVSRSDARGAAPRPVREPLKAAYLIVGDDLPKIEAALKRLKQRIVEESGSDLNISEFEAPDDPGVTVVNAANTMAFLGGTRLVLVHHADTWAKAEKDQIVGYLASPAPDACLALVAAKLTPSDPLRSAMGRHGQVLEYMAPKEAELPSWLQREAGKMGIQLGLQQARFLVNRCGENQNILLREVEKLDLYADGRRINDDDILLLTHATYEASIFDLLDSLALGRGAAAFSAADELLADLDRREARGAVLPDHASLPAAQPGGGPPGCGLRPGGHPGGDEAQSVPDSQAGGAGEHPRSGGDSAQARSARRDGCPHEGHGEPS